MKILLIGAFFLLARALERNQNCTTPYNEKAKCISVNACPGLLGDIKSKETTRFEFIKQSKCGYDTELLVCCGTKSYNKADEIGKTVADLFDSKTNVRADQNRGTTDVGDSLPDEAVCGVQEIGETTRIFGGEMSKLYEFPWMAALEYKSKLGEETAIRCGGTLISKRHVLTAAHCISSVSYELTRVRLGEWNITSDPDCQELQGTNKCADKVVKVGIERTTLHPLYKRRTFRNDIALLRLESEVQYTDSILPICLPELDHAPPPLNTMMFVAGWGTTENGTMSDVKMHVLVPLVANTRCDEGSNLVTNINQLCAGGVAGKDSCTGDSGGPLMTVRKNSDSRSGWFQEGIVSYGKGCGFPYPAVYTRVSRYITWIKDVLKET